MPSCGLHAAAKALGTRGGDWRCSRPEGEATWHLLGSWMLCSPPPTPQLRLRTSGISLPGAAHPPHAALPAPAPAALHQQPWYPPPRLVPWLQRAAACPAARPPGHAEPLPLLRTRPHSRGPPPPAARPLPPWTPGPAPVPVRRPGGRRQLPGSFSAAAAAWRLLAGRRMPRSRSSAHPLAARAPRSS